MNQSDTITKIIPALLECQKKIEAVEKKSENPFFKNKYADINSLIEACKTILNSNGIIVLQPINGCVVETFLLHTSGEWLSSATRIVSKTENNPQDQGSAITYARRYGLQSMLFMSAEDDDGEKATDHKTTSPSPVKTTETGLVVKCSVCGETMVEKEGVNKEGKKWHGYFCPNSTKETNHPPRFI